MATTDFRRIKRYEEARDFLLNLKLAYLYKHGRWPRVAVLPPLFAIALEEATAKQLPPAISQKLMFGGFKQHPNLKIWGLTFRLDGTPGAVPRLL